MRLTYTLHSGAFPVIFLFFIFIASVIQAIFQSDIGTLLERVGTGKESLSFMKRRIRRLAVQWATAARRLDDKLRNQWREQQRVNMRRLCTDWKMKVGGEENKSVLWFHLFTVLCLATDDEPVKDALLGFNRNLPVAREIYSSAPNLMEIHLFKD